MLGYIKIDRYELTLRSYLSYKRSYCSICNSLKNNCGVLSCSLLSYDIILYAIILDEIAEDKQAESFRCPINPFHRIKINSSKTVRNYCSFMNYYIALKKAEDNCIDEGRFRDKIFYKTLKNNRKYLKSVFTHDVNLSILDAQFKKVFHEENTLNIDSDGARNDLMCSVGDLYYFVFFLFIKEYGFELAEESLNLYYKFFSNLGKLIYVIDAIDDLNQDITAERFNVLKDRFKQLPFSKFRIYLSVMTEYFIDEIKEASSKLSFSSRDNKEIVDNICNFGLHNSLDKAINSLMKQFELEGSDSGDIK